MANKEFIENLRDALVHLYDPNHLRRSPLASLLGVTDQANPYLALQSAIIETISALQPKADVPSHAPSWRTYEILFCRYVQQLGAQETADQMGLSERQVRRAQHDALDTLAQTLSVQFDLEAKLGSTSESTAAQAPPSSLSIDEELAWLRSAPLDEAADLAQELAAVLDLVKPLATQHQVCLDVEVTAQPLSLAVHPVALNQMLLSLVSVAISWAPGGQVRISDRPGRQAEICVRAERRHGSSEDLSENEMANAEIARKLAGMSGGQLDFASDEGVLTARLALPESERVAVLAIDDNADTLRLLQRHADGTRYHIVGTGDPDEVLDLVQKHSPRIIVLDVMMPRVDGWKVLGRLRQHPLTSRIPIVVCTILAQEELAVSLGASDFVRKPFSQQDLLAALNRQTADLNVRARRAGPEPR